MKLSELSKLTSLTHLNLSLAESFEAIAHPPLWISSLPISLKTLSLHCFPSVTCSHLQYDGTFTCTVNVARTYGDCLPRLGHLTHLNKLTCILAGPLSSHSLISLPVVTLRELAFGQLPNTNPDRIEVSENMLKAFSQFPSLRSVCFLLVQDESRTSHSMCPPPFAERLRLVRSSTGSRFTVREEKMKLSYQQCLCYQMWYRDG